MQIMVKTPYPKGWIDYGAQVEKLKRRGLAIPDEALARRFLSYSNYYRFTGYCLRFQHMENQTGERIFNRGVSFSDVMDLYRIDRELRDCIADALETVEISFRSAVAYNFAASHGAFGHTIRDNFDRRFVARPSDANGRLLPSRYDEWHDALVNETKRSNELFVKHFEKRYSQFPDLPIWTALEICSFGTLSRMFANMLRVDMRPIAAHYSLQASTLDSWIHTFVYVRNICAHHSRLWDKTFAISPQLPPGKMWDAVRPFSNRLYAIAMLLNWMLAHDSVDDKVHADWKCRLERIMRSFADRFPALLGHTGFPSDWETNNVWSIV